jgi:SAM-dependent methyltransferase
MNADAPCHLCGGDLHLLAGYGALHRVTSDCKPWPAGGRKACCRQCGTVQVVLDAAWKKDCHDIYSTYSVYHQGGGSEQAVFDAAAQGTPRSRRLLEKVTAAASLPPRGRALDIGCGNGNFIRSFAEVQPDWRLNGAEYNAIYRDQVLAIPRVEAFYSGGLESIPGPFDFLSLIHVLEHIEDPVPFLRKVAALGPAAQLLVEVPFFWDNPYELLIADHATHYTPPTLVRVLHRAGLVARELHTDWILKEISALTVVSASAPPGAVDPAAETARAEAAIDFLAAVRDHAKQLREKTAKLGIFGTSIGGTWLHAELGGRVDFFVDEDASRIGHRHLGTPILSPAQVPAGSAVFMPLAERVARAAAARLQPASAGTYSWHASAAA